MALLLSRAAIMFCFDHVWNMSPVKLWIKVHVSLLCTNVSIRNKQKWDLYFTSAASHQKLLPFLLHLFIQQNISQSSNVSILFIYFILTSHFVNYLLHWCWMEDTLWKTDRYYISTSFCVSTNLPITEVVAMLPQKNTMTHKLGCIYCILTQYSTIKS